ncbi:MAG: 3-deoxy-7-phosphoheptulonate synthase, partial [Gemmatimonadetes bacterium]|nr:3-deoxy-7-phosphoheptulonate synthase [Gemmatimonadota bacterium]NIQ59891.1 3-deoxy-7-phosphoheptulonate synthase [Gemmatimonadota bacterium]NIU80084.1 3-deoxy-7-phosphoheptulonate synthase [Gammaproteobacteria bacterium]NIX48504.1 3-deoxy-7-phosphoheptulonate synthase [Gemmatimonadota bacterium]NIY12951.1 3-deoxy-7-phosphoheptulonate synthase [Gemmatimonadota bacterium]
LRDIGATILRGGAFKPRTSPYSFQGLGLRGLELLARARAETGLAIVTEAL